LNPAEINKAITSVLTVRDYAPTRLAPESAIRRILEAARMTASAHNRQTWYFIVVKHKETLRELTRLSRTGEHIAGASFAIVVVTNPSNRWHRIDAARAVQSMAIQAWSEGLGCSWVGTIDRERVKKLLSIPKNLYLLTIVPFGYPKRRLKGNKKKRKQLSEVAFCDRFGRSVSRIS
jgi:nitroreductase